MELRERSTLRTVVVTLVVLGSLTVVANCITVTPCVCVFTTSHRARERSMYAAAYFLLAAPPFFLRSLAAPPFLIRRST
jgi:hypothetical protein